MKELLESLGDYPLFILSAYASFIMAVVIAAGVGFIFKERNWNYFMIWCLKLLATLTWIIVVLSVAFFIVMWLKK